MKNASRLSAYLPILLLILYFGHDSKLMAQQFSTTSGFRSYWQIGVNGGTSIFFGDIKQYRVWPETNNENEWRMGVGLYMNKQFTPVIGLRGQGMYGQIAGSRRERNMFFQGDYFEFSLIPHFNINNIFAPYNEERLLNVNIFIGLGLTNFNTELFDLTTHQSLRKMGHGNGKGINGRTLEGIFIGGMGLDFRISERFNVNLETSNRIMNSDRMDGVESGFEYDIYNYSSLGVAYKFGFSKKGRRSKSLPPYHQSETETNEYELPAEEPMKPSKNSLDILVVEPIINTAERKPPKVIEEEEPMEVVEEVVMEPVVVPVSPMQSSPAFEYRVQVLAKYGKRMPKESISNMYNLPVNELKEDMRNGYYIYTIGSYATYEQARNKRNQLRSSNGITDAFVVAFENGKRLDKLP